MKLLLSLTILFFTTHSWATVGMEEAPRLRKFDTDPCWEYAWPFVTGGNAKLNVIQKESIMKKIPSILPSIEACRADIQYPKLSEQERRKIQIRILRIYDELEMDED